MTASVPGRVAEIVTPLLGVAPTAARLLAGGQSDVYAVSVHAAEDYFLKLARPGENARITREAIVYPLLRCPRPTLVASDAGEGFLLTASAGATTLARRFKTPADCSTQFRRMGRLLRDFHATSLLEASHESRSMLQSGRDELARIVRRDAASRFARVSDSPEHAARWPAFEAVVEAVIALPGQHLLHGDYNTRQVLLNDAGDVVAICDFEYACLGPVELDLLRMELSGIRGRSDFYAGYDRSRVALPFDVLDALDDASQDSPDRAAAIARLHEAIDRRARDPAPQEPA